MKLGLHTPNNPISSTIYTLFRSERSDVVQALFFSSSVFVTLMMIKLLKYVV